MRTHPLLLSRLLALLGAIFLLAPPAPAGASAADTPLPNGHFYTQAGGEAGLGFAIADDAQGRFWSSFESLGGVAALGYPASQPYYADGFSYQAVQGALLQWRPELGRAVLANTFEQFSQAGLDQQLLTDHQIPLPISDDGSNGDYQRAVQIRLGWLTDPGIKARYLANPDPAANKTWSVADAIARYGLPMSKPEAFGPFVAQRFQRIAFQRWTTAVPGMPAPGTVVRVLGGDLAKETGLVPQDAQHPQTVADVSDLDSGADTSSLPAAQLSSPVGDATTPQNAQPPTGPNQFPLAPCRASAIDPRANQNVPGRPAPEAGTYLLYGSTPVKLEHNDNCWSPSQIQQMGNHRAISDITEVVIHWTDLDYARSAYALRRGVSVHWLVPLAPDPSQPTLELIDPRNAAWHAGPLNNGKWEDAAHMLCYPSEPCRPNGNVHSLGIENVGNSVPNAYQVSVMADIISTMIREGYPIQLDRQHIVGHREINRQKPDPGNLDINALIALVKQRLGAAPPISSAAPPVAAPTPTPAADGSGDQPWPLNGSAAGQVTGNSGGASLYYTLPAPGSPLTIHFSYTGIVAPSGGVTLTVYQGNARLGTISPPGDATDGATLTVTPPGGAALTVQVTSYLPQPVQYQLSVAGS